MIKPRKKQDQRRDESEAARLRRERRRAKQLGPVIKGVADFCGLDSIVYGALGIYIFLHETRHDERKPILEKCEAKIKKALTEGFKQYLGQPNVKLRIKQPGSKRLSDSVIVDRLAETHQGNWKKMRAELEEDRWRKGRISQAYRNWKQRESDRKTHPKR